jgi:tetratricopeptide (TPR) repeat protein
MSRSICTVAAAVLGSLIALPALADNYLPGGDADPRVRAADFLAQDQRYFSAASALLQIQNENPTQKLAPEYFWKLADTTLSFGMQERAEAIYREVAATSKDAVAVANARIRLAEFLYQRGYDPEAVEELMSMRDTLPQDVVPDWQGVLARALMAQGNYGDAAEVLTDLDNSKRQSPYTRYNLGVSLINDGRAGQGVNVLDRMGRMSVFDEETLSLRDKANVGLGYHFLRTQEGGTAIPIFGRVRSVGPFSNRALLGLGWAYLAPEGTKQKKVEVGDEGPDLEAFRSLSTIGAILRPGFLDTDIYKRAGLKPFRLDAKDIDQEQRLKRALVPWVELMSRDPMDPAVQEAFLAVPFSLDRIGAHLQAKEYYEKAITALEETRKRLDYAREQVTNGRMVSTIIDRDPDSEAGWTWKLYDLPAAPETFYLQALIAENRYQEALKNFRDVRLLGRNLEAWSQRLDKLQAEAATRQSVDVPVSLLFKQALARQSAGTAASRPTQPLSLKLGNTLNAAEGSPAESEEALTPPPLTLAEAPEHFDGLIEKITALKARIEADKPKIKAAEAAQAKVLEQMALDELAGQKKQTEKYLVEARFALARIYDRTLRPESPSP